MIQNISAINTNCPEGRLLMAALAKITTESQTDKTIEEVISQCHELAKYMFKDSMPLMEPETHIRPGFEKELEYLINRYSMESGSNTPDYILVDYMKNSLDNFHKATWLRDNWYGGKRSVINDQAEMWETDNTKLLQAQ
jgi:hypothetical protein